MKLWAIMRQDSNRDVAVGYCLHERRADERCAQKNEHPVFIFYVEEVEVDTELGAPPPAFEGEFGDGACMKREKT